VCRFTAVHVHTKYDSENFYHDVAVLRTKEPLWGLADDPGSRMADLLSPASTANPFGIPVDSSALGIDASRDGTRGGFWPYYPLPEDTKLSVIGYGDTEKQADHTEWAPWLVGAVKSLVRPNPFLTASRLTVRNPYSCCTRYGDACDRSMGITGWVAIAERGIICALDVDSTKAAGSDGATLFQDTCQGDSGGPLFFMRGGRPVLVGVVSFGAGCGNRGIPGMYAAVHSHLAWIMSMVNNNQALMPLTVAEVTFTAAARLARPQCKQLAASPFVTWGLLASGGWQPSSASVLCNLLWSTLDQMDSTYSVWDTMHGVSALAGSQLVNEAQGSNIGSGTKEPIIMPGGGGKHSMWAFVMVPVWGKLEVDTHGSAIDTLLALFHSPSRFPTADDLFRLDFNDDCGTGKGVNLKTTGSCLRAYLRPRAYYFIGVDGAKGAQGAIKLKVTFTHSDASGPAKCASVAASKRRRLAAVGQFPAPAARPWHAAVDADQLSRLAADHPVFVNATWELEHAGSGGAYFFLLPRCVCCIAVDAKTHLLRLLRCLFFLVHCAGGGIPRRELVIGGSDVADDGKKDYPFFVSFLNAERICGGSLIHRQFVLTAAHCLDENKDRKYMRVLWEGRLFK
jgi:hypothetical protein